MDIMMKYGDQKYVIECYYQSSCMIFDGSSNNNFSSLRKGRASASLELVFQYYFTGIELAFNDKD